MFHMLNQNLSNINHKFLILDKVFTGELSKCVSRAENQNWNWYYKKMQQKCQTVYIPTYAWDNYACIRFPS